MLASGPRGVVHPAHRRCPARRRRRLRILGVQAGLGAGVLAERGALGSVRRGPAERGPEERRRVAEGGAAMRLVVLPESVHAAHRLHVQSRDGHRLLQSSAEDHRRGQQLRQQSLRGRLSARA